MNRYFTRLGLIIMMLTASGSCEQNMQQQLEVEIAEHRFFSELSSASGVTLINDTIALVGDDMPWMIRLSDDLSVKDTLRISGIEMRSGGRIPYQIKPDYECMEYFEHEGSHYTLIIPSGSKVDMRDTAILVNNTEFNSIVKRNIRSLFNTIHGMCQLGEESLNIEGLAVSPSEIYLFHRGNISGNYVIELSKTQFMRFLLDGYNAIDSISVHSVDLPEFNDLRPGFSGATFLPRNNILLFTASMEDTRSALSDGEVAGSFIGIMLLDDIRNGDIVLTLVKENNKILKKKLEGIAILSESGSGAEVITVCDNDDGSSDIYLLKIKLPDLQQN